MKMKGVHPLWGESCRVESRDQKQPGLYLEGGRERTLGTRLDKNEVVTDLNKGMLFERTMDNSRLIFIASIDVRSW